MDDTKSDPLLLRVPEVMERLQLGRGTIYQLAAEGRLGRWDWPGIDDASMNAPAIDHPPRLHLDAAPSAGQCCATAIGSEVEMSIGSSLREPCASCGEETASGSNFYAERHTVTHADGTRSFLCQLCESRIRSSHHSGQMTDDQVRSYVESSIESTGNRGMPWGSGGATPGGI